MEHNLETIMKVLNRYLTPDLYTGLIPMTPMHMEINKMKAELREMQKHWNKKGFIPLAPIELIEEILGE